MQLGETTQCSLLPVRSNDNIQGTLLITINFETSTIQSNLGELNNINISFFRCLSLSFKIKSKKIKDNDVYLKKLNLHFEIYTAYDFNIVLH